MKALWSLISCLQQPKKEQKHKDDHNASYGSMAHHVCGKRDKTFPPSPSCGLTLPHFLALVRHSCTSSLSVPRNSSSNGLKHQGSEISWSLMVAHGRSWSLMVGTPTPRCPKSHSRSWSLMVAHGRWGCLLWASQDVLGHCFIVRTRTSLDDGTEIECAVA